MASGKGQASDLVVMGRINGLYGVRGWVKVYSETEPRENIVQYSPWYLRLRDGWHEVPLAAGRRHGKGVVAQLAGYDDRDAAAALVGAEIAVRRDRFPPPAEGEYYWADLIGLRVETVDGTDLGVVDHLMETGANDVLVVCGERERLIPFLPGDVVAEIDLESGCMWVDWDPDF